MSRLWILVGCSAAALVAAAIALTPDSPNVPRDTSVYSVSRLSLPSRASTLPIETAGFIDPAWYRSAWDMDEQTVVPRGHVIAGVVNHHALASDLLARFFSSMKRARPDATRFILISPDHFGAGRGVISTHERGYLASGVQISVDVSATRALVEDGLATLEHGAMFEKEHGIAALIPFLAHEFPRASIVPVSIRGTSDRAYARALGVRLASLVDATTIVIVSADMSHYLDEQTALQNDVMTLDWLQTLNDEEFARRNDDFIDNGAGMVALAALFAARKQTPTFALFDHGISTTYGGPTDDTTSYLTGVWSE